MSIKSFLGIGILLIFMAAFSYASIPDSYVGFNPDDPASTVIPQKTDEELPEKSAAGDNGEAASSEKLNESSQSALEQQRAEIERIQQLRDDLVQQQKQAAAAEKELEASTKTETIEKKTESVKKGTSSAKMEATENDSSAKKTPATETAATETEANSSDSFHAQYIVIGVFLLSAGGFAAYLVAHREPG